jgi:hypothetical protein
MMCLPQVAGVFVTFRLPLPLSLSLCRLNMQVRCVIDSEAIVIADTSSDSSSLQTEISRFDEEGSTRKPKSWSTKGFFLMRWIHRLTVSTSMVWQLVWNSTCYRELTVVTRFPLPKGMLGIFT